MKIKLHFFIFGINMFCKWLLVLLTGGLFLYSESIASFEHKDPGSEHIAAPKEKKKDTITLVPTCTTCHNPHISMKKKFGSG